MVYNGTWSAHGHVHCTWLDTHIIHACRQKGWDRPRQEGAEDDGRSEAWRVLFGKGAHVVECNGFDQKANGLVCRCDKGWCSAGDLRLVRVD